jgi:hypothetical protein
LACLNRQLRADQRLDARRERGFMKPRRARYTVAIEQGDGGIAERRRPIDQCLG